MIVGDDISIDTGESDDRVTLNRVNVADEINIERRNANDSLA